MIVKAICIKFSDTEEFWDSEGLQMKMVEPMKKWAVSYNGEMVHQTTGQKFQVTLEVFRIFI